ncbi:MAG TPA: radical SAM protein [Verrucomicrobiae bacterium]|nr:radical SAM protein [Verrucomicrobiae bacterium]
MIVFGPVPSRRLGRSLGINHIPPKVCCYACVYCQVGATTRQEIGRCTFYPPDQIEREVKERVTQLRAAGETIDYLTFVPDGEPTLDRHLGELIDRLRPLGPKIAVITNGALLYQPDVRTELVRPDWVSLKVDSVRERMWHNINRPHAALQLPAVLDGMRQFAGTFKGTLTTETMLVHMCNDTVQDLESVAAFVGELRPATAYVAVPTRPPAEPWVEPPSEETINAAYQVFRARLPRVELLVGDEGNVFTSTGDAAGDLLSIAAVHPLRADAVAALLAKTGADFGVVRRLIAEKKLAEEHYQGQRYYLRRLPGTPRPRNHA